MRHTIQQKLVAKVDREPNSYKFIFIYKYIKFYYYFQKKEKGGGKLPTMSGAGCSKTLALVMIPN